MSYASQRRIWDVEYLGVGTVAYTYAWMPCVISRTKITRGIYSRFLCENLSACRKITSGVHVELAATRKKIYELKMTRMNLRKILSFHEIECLILEIGEKWLEKLLNSFLRETKISVYIVSLTTVRIIKTCFVSRIM